MGSTSYQILCSSVKYFLSYSAKSLILHSLKHEILSKSRRMIFFRLQCFPYVSKGSKRNSTHQNFFIVGNVTATEQIFCSNSIKTFSQNLNRMKFIHNISDIEIILYINQNLGLFLDSIIIIH